MKIAVFTDTHANLPALQAVIQAIQHEGYDLAVHLGDAIGIGPFPAECLDMLLNLPNCYYLMGNHDALFLHGLPRPKPTWMSEGEARHQLWTHAQIDSKLRGKIAEWPYLIQEQFEGVWLTFLHYALNHAGDDFRPIEKNSSGENLDQLFAHVQSDIVFYGHHHPFLDATGRCRYINPGSLGCFAEPVARFAIVACEGGNVTVEHRSVSYDDAELIEAFEQRQVAEREFLKKIFFGNRF